MLKAYIGAKIILGEPMDEVTYLKKHGNTPEELPDREPRPGYHVVYPLDYHSWSPKEVFENAYRQLLDGEAKFIIDICGGGK